MDVLAEIIPCPILQDIVPLGAAAENGTFTGGVQLGSLDGEPRTELG